jgi:hypothetical protein
MVKALELKTIFRGVDRISKPLGKMGRRIKRFAARAVRALRRVAAVAARLASVIGRGLKIGLIAAGGALVAFGVILTRTADKMDALAKQSKRLDFDIEALQEWGFVAEQSGISTEEFSKGLDTFAKAIGEAKLGQGTLTTMLKRNDRAFLDQIKNTKDSAEAFDLYIAKMQAIEDPTERVAFGALAFGRAGKKMANIATLDADAIANLRKEMRENGVVTMEQAANAEAFNDALNSAKMTIQGLIFEALGPLLPELKKGLRGFREWVVANKEMIRTKIVKFMKDLVQGAKDFFERAKKFNEQHKPFDKLKRIFEGIGKGLSWIVDNFDLIKSVLLVVLPTILAFKTAMLVITAANTIKGLMDIQKGIGGIGTAAGTATGAKGLGGLNAAMGVLAAGTFGWTIGTILSKQVLEPLADARAELKLLLQETKLQFDQLRKAGTTGEKQIAIEEKKRQVVEFATGPGSLEDVIDFFAGPLDFIQERQKIFDEAVSEVRSLQGDVNKEIALQNEVLREAGISIPQVAGVAATAGLQVIPGGKSESQLVTSEERTQRMVEESRRTETQKTEITIKDETGKAQVTGGTKGSKVQLERTGTF